MFLRSSACWALVGLFTISNLLALKAFAAEVTCYPAAPQRMGQSLTYKLGDVWTGTRASPGAAVVGTSVLVAFYDAERWVTVAVLNPRKEEVCSIRLPSRFAGWDAHNSLAVGVAPDGTVHIAGNAHASPLFYAQGFGSDLSSFRAMQLTGKDEDRATYPTFARTADNTLMFYYRNGMAGNGIFYADYWTGTEWRRLGALFVAVDGLHSTSAYASNFVRGPDGETHVAIVWRRTTDVASNYLVTYAKTKDFRLWSGRIGSPVEGPIGPSTSDLIDMPGQHAGLVNAAHLVLDPDGEPVILYPRYGAGGTDAILAARPGQNGWNIREIAVSKSRSNVSGGGAMTNLPNVLEFEPLGWDACVTVLLPPHVERLVLNLKSLDSHQSLDCLKTGGVDTPPIAIPSGMAEAANLGLAVLQSGFDGPSRGRLSWFAQAPDHDQPRQCTPQAPSACAPPTAPLRWTVNQAALAD
jgi:hypothetical protein